MSKDKKYVGYEHNGAVHSWIQNNALNGSLVKWGSNDQLEFKRALTVSDLEDLAQQIADAVGKDVALLKQQFDAVVRERIKQEGRADRLERKVADLEQKCLELQRYIKRKNK